MVGLLHRSVHPAFLYPYSVISDFGGALEPTPSYSFTGRAVVLYGPI
jgi:hypothetical protein